MAAKKTTTKKATTRKQAPSNGKTTTDKAPQKMSALDAAAKVLCESKQPLRSGELIEQMAAKGYWKSPGGQTPAATLSAAIAHEITTKGQDARFKKTGRGLFAANK